MLRLADIVRRHGAEYRARHGARLLPSHARALFDIEHCRTPRLGGHLARCSQCQGEHVLYHSCHNRACPRCGYEATSRWLDKQRELLLPVPYFHVVFTLPAELRRTVRAHQRALLPVLFRAAFESLATLCKDARYLGASIGALAVLHTWTRSLEWHPHVHLLVPGGGVAPDGCTWVPTPRRKTRFLVPVRALSKLFRARFLALARRAVPQVLLPEIPWDKSWVVFAKPVVHGSEQVLEYLGRYVHRTALADGALAATDDQTVTFRYRDSRDQLRKTMTLPATEFLRRFLQHVPPKGFHRVRAFGLLHPDRRQLLRRLQLLLETVDSPSPRPLRLAKTAPTCPQCGQPTLRLLRRLSPAECLTRGALDLGVASARAPPADHPAHGAGASP
jgi:hypothetical protein